MSDGSTVAPRGGLPQLVRFVVVGVINTAFSYAVYSLFLFVGFSYAVANLLALIISIGFSFKMQGRFVFASQRNDRVYRFVASWAVIYVINVFLIGRFVAFGFNAYVSGALAIPIMTILSFVMQKFFVFRRSPSRGL